MQFDITAELQVTVTAEDKEEAMKHFNRLVGGWKATAALRDEIESVDVVDEDIDDDDDGEGETVAEVAGVNSN